MGGKDIPKPKDGEDSPKTKDGGNSPKSRRVEYNEDEKHLKENERGDGSGDSRYENAKYEKSPDQLLYEIEKSLEDDKENDLKLEQLKELLLEEMKDQIKKQNVALAERAEHAMRCGHTKQDNHENANVVHPEGSCKIKEKDFAILEEADKQVETVMKEAYKALEFGNNKKEDLKKMLLLKKKLESVSEIFNAADDIETMAFGSNKTISADVMDQIKTSILEEIPDHHLDASNIDVLRALLLRTKITWYTWTIVIRRRFIYIFRYKLQEFRMIIKMKILMYANTFKGNCEISEFGCSHDCDILSKKCICPHGMKLDSETKTCQWNEDFIAEGELTDLHQDIVRLILLYRQEYVLMKTVAEMIPEDKSPEEETAEGANC
uniref:uncharacterized protein LOC120335993 n=1 Tax=Styela clava TaxID=7725 RepID=UPI00193A2337|nr:uncharacterized protein LOC120335993 [Styela clava]